MRWLIICGLWSCWSMASAVDTSTLRQHLQQYCYDCHGTAKTESDVDYQNLSDEELLADHRLLDDTLWLVSEHEMPPAKADKPLPDAQRQQMVDAIEAILVVLENAAPNDPGVVVMPRINHREYDLVIRALTGQNLGIGAFLTEDGLAGAGFYNVGHAQNMTVGQFEAFLSAAKKVVEHALPIPERGLVWEDRPWPADPSRRAALKELGERFEKSGGRLYGQEIKEHKQALRNAVDLRLPVAYLEAAWRYRHRVALGMADVSISDVADAYEVPLYASILRKTWALLHEGELPDGTVLKDVAKLVNGPENRFVAELVTEWQALPAPGAGDPASARDAISALTERRRHFGASRWGMERGEIEQNPPKRADKQAEWGATQDGKQPSIVDLTKAEGEEIYLLVATGGDGAEGDTVVWRDGEVDGKPWQDLFAAPRAEIGADASFAGDELVVSAPSALALTVPAGAEELRLTLGIDDERGPEASVQGWIVDRRDLPENLDRFLIGRRVLGTKRSKPASRLERAVGGVSGLLKAEDRIRDYDIFTMLPPEVIAATKQRVRDEHVELGDVRKTFVPAWPETLARMDANERAELDRLAALMTDVAAEHDAGSEEHAAEAMITDFATRAWRRTPTSAEIDGLMGFYREARNEEGQSFIAGIRASLTVVLVSPHFLYRFQESRHSEEPYPLPEGDIAERLAFALWGSVPDERLLQLADGGGLGDEEALRSEVQRMLADDRIDGLAGEFAGQWLRFSKYEQEAAPDAERFDDYYEDDLEQAMAREIELFFVDLFQQNRPVTNVLASDYTFLNEDLAKHYGIKGVDGKHMRRVELGPDVHRGGVIGMGAIHTMTSNSLRTSAVRRGAWVYEHLLGYHLPEPPANVPQISDDERSEEGLTVRQQLEQHRNNPACFSCHDRIDPLGVAMEKFDAIGRWRERDLAKEPIDDQGTFVSNGRTLDGLSGLHTYLQEHREQFLSHFCEQLLAYCLGRDIQPTDDPLIADMQAALAANDYRPRAAIETVITSRQFRFRRDEQH